MISADSLTLKAATNTEVNEIKRQEIDEHIANNQAFISDPSIFISLPSASPVGRSLLIVVAVVVLLIFIYRCLELAETSQLQHQSLGTSTAQLKIQKLHISCRYDQCSASTAWSHNTWGNEKNRCAWFNGDKRYVSSA